MQVWSGEFLDRLRGVSGRKDPEGKLESNLGVRYNAPSYCGIFFRVTLGFSGEALGFG